MESRYQSIASDEGWRIADLGKSSLRSKSKWHGLEEDSDDHMKMEYFSLGISSGASAQMLIVTFCMLFLSTYHDAGPLNELSKEYYPMFRMIFFVLWFFILYGLNLFVWKRYKVGYHELMGMDREVHSYQMVLRAATSLAYIVFTCFVVYALMVAGLIVGTKDSDWKHLFPALALGLPILLYFSPSNLTGICFGDNDTVKHRYGLVKELGCVLAAPFVTCTPLRSLIGDILCSMPKTLTDLSYTICLFSDVKQLQDGSHECIQGPLASSSSARYFFVTLAMSMAPYILRCTQALRSYADQHQSDSNKTNLLNAFKYLMSVVVTLLNVVKVNSAPGLLKDRMTTAWFIVAACTTLFSYYADVAMGWGLMNWNSKNFLLRDELTYPKPWYYMAIVGNFFMRLAWAFNISPGQPYVAQNVILLFGCLEIFRRFVWLTFRVENMDLNAKAKKAAHGLIEMPSR